MPQSLKPQSYQSNSLQPEQLKWLFVAEFSDGSIVRQTEEDTSTLDASKSAYYDVVARKDDLVGFSFVHTDGNQYVTVDLKTGAFIVNGTPMHLHDQNFDPSKHTLELIYFREGNVDIVQDNTTSTAVKQYYTRYFLGWQTTDVRGKNHKATIAVG